MTIVRMLVAACGVLLAIAGVAAQDAPGNKPVRVEVTMFVIDVLRIDDASLTVTIDFGMLVEWDDPRLADPEQPHRVFGIAEIWNPRLQVVNEASLRARWPDVIEVDAAGHATRRQRFQGTLTEPFDFTEFPVDRQILKVALVSRSLVGDIEIVLQQKSAARMESFTIPDWWVGQPSMRVQPLQVIDQPHAGVVLEMPAHREFSIYIWNAILPLIMVVFMSWAVFWIHPQHIAPQVGLGATSVLTLVAYRFALSSRIPNLPYLTRMDLFLLGASILVFLALVEVVVTSYLIGRGKTDVAEKVDLAARIGFPVLFGVVLVLVFM